MKTDDWHRAYREGWGKRLVPEAYAHPAKASYSLAQRIYEHAIAEGWLRPGDCVLDPFGGVGGFAYHALYHGLHFVGVELEAKWATLGGQNIARWNARYSTLPGWGTATLVQGDSRQLAALVDRPCGSQTLRVGEAGACVSSPPYADGCNHTGGDDRQPDRMEGTPSYGVAYGTTPGQLGAMPAGNPPQHGADGVVSSPPYEGVVQHDGGPVQQQGGTMHSDYGDTPNNLANTTDFWAAARTIVEQVYTVLRPGAHAIWVLKAYVRDKRIVDFPDQWRQMCEACGFETLHVHRTWLVEDHGAQGTLEGGVEKREKRRVSFFRRLHMKKYPHLAIDYEIVLCMRKGDTQ